MQSTGALPKLQGRQARRLQRPSVLAEFASDMRIQEKIYPSLGSLREPAAVSDTQQLSIYLRRRYREYSESQTCFASNSKAQASTVEILQVCFLLPQNKYISFLNNLRPRGRDKLHRQITFKVFTITTLFSLPPAL